MVVLSDISGPNAIIDPSGYLTGYPLLESKRYVLARTWAAPEMGRPGCVWTHSILIEFSDLAVLDEPVTLRGAFLRPSSTDQRKAYSHQLRYLNPTRNAEAHRDQIPIGAVAALRALYSFPEKKILLLADGVTDAEEAILMIWRQQWPRLRRQFRFCSSSFADRSAAEWPFDLQVVPSRERMQRGSDISNLIFVNSAERSEVEPAWFEAAVTDLGRAASTALREFLKVHGANTSSGRAAFAPLLIIYEELERFKQQPSFELVKLTTSRFTGDEEARPLKTAVTHLWLKSAPALTREESIFLLDNQDLIDADLVVKYGQKITQALWAFDRERLWKMAAGTPVEMSIFESLGEWLSVQELVTELTGNTAVTETALHLFPTLLEQPEFWRASQLRSIGLQQASGASRQGIVEAMIRSGTRDLARSAYERFGAVTLLEALGHCASDNVERTTLTEWARVATSDPASLSRCLSSGSFKTRGAIVLLMYVTDPDTPNEQQSKVISDSWLRAVRSANGDLTKRDEQHLHTFLLARGLGKSNTDQAQLIVFSFAFVHLAVARDGLPWESWRLLEDRVPPPPFFWLGWDKCQRIRAGVARAFVERNLTPSAFMELTSEEEIFRELVEEAARIRNGRSYLRSVYKKTRHSASSAQHRWSEIISDAL